MKKDSAPKSIRIYRFSIFSFFRIRAWQRVMMMQPFLSRNVHSVFSWYVMDCFFFSKSWCLFVFYLLTSNFDLFLISRPIRSSCWCFCCSQVGAAAVLGDSSDKWKKNLVLVSFCNYLGCPFGLERVPCEIETSTPRLCGAWVLPTMTGLLWRDELPEDEAVGRDLLCQHLIEGGKGASWETSTALAGTAWRRTGSWWGRSQPSSTACSRWSLPLSSLNVVTAPICS